MWFLTMNHSKSKEPNDINPFPRMCRIVSSWPHPRDNAPGGSANRLPAAAVKSCLCDLSDIADSVVVPSGGDVDALCVRVVTQRPLATFQDRGRYFGTFQRLVGLRSEPL
jgi:hypothetical protein